MTEWFSISIALIATAISLVTFLTNYKREKEKYIPVFLINKITDFGSSYTFQLKNIKDNYVVIKKVYSTSKNLQVEYQGVMDVEIISGKIEKTKERFRGDTLKVKVLSQESFEAQIYVEGIDFAGKKFKVCTPCMKFTRGKKMTNIESRYLEYV
ncbi:hypothetical protein CSV73_14275 [Sporosarcina sp. P1]|nr:hypothetical protein CSV73_14275 [Sporosarcina sp. P1]